MASGCITYISYFLVPQTFDASWKPVCLYGLWTGGILSFLWSYLCVSNSYGRYFLEPTIESLLSDLWNSLLTSHIFHQSKEFLSELQWKYATARN